MDLTETPRFVLGRFVGWILIWIFALTVVGVYWLLVWVAERARKWAKNLLRPQ